MKTASFSHPFDPIIDKHSKVLILGTFPSLKSFENNFYYAHPRNQFWALLESVYSTSISDKKAFILEKHLALWDVIKVTKREKESSLDSHLNVKELNDFDQFLHTYPSLQTIVFTSKTAQKLFEKKYKHLSITRLYLPSPSPAYTLKFEKKVESWQKLLLLTSD